MGSQVLVQKKISRDLGLHGIDRVTQHFRRNLVQIIQVEALLEEAGWNTEPEERREDFISLEGGDLCEDMTQFWALCTQNRNSGIVSLAQHNPVEFQDVYCLAKEKEEKLLKKDLQKMSKDLPHLVSNIPDSHPMKMYYYNQLTDVLKSKHFDKIHELYELVLDAINFENSESSSSCDSDGD